MQVATRDNKFPTNLQAFSFAFASALSIRDARPGNDGVMSSAAPITLRGKLMDLHGALSHVWVPQDSPDNYQALRRAMPSVLYGFTEIGCEINATAKQVTVTETLEPLLCYILWSTPQFPPVRYRLPSFSIRARSTCSSTSVETLSNKARSSVA